MVSGNHTFPMERQCLAYPRASFPSVIFDIQGCTQQTSTHVYKISRNSNLYSIWDINLVMDWI